MRRFRVTLGAVLVSGAALFMSAAPAAARDAMVSSFDGTELFTHFYPSGIGQPAPTVLVGPRFGFPGDTNPDANTSDVIGAAVLRSAGYNVLTWDPRGFGGSGGTSEFDSPAFEARDVQALVSYVSQQPEAKLDGPGDPRVGMSGSSYGGGIQISAAALDHRLDAIAPDIGWSDLAQGLFPAGAVKALFPYFCALARGGPLPGGILSPPQAIPGRMDAHFESACDSADATGAISAEDLQWFSDHGPGSAVGDVRAPTLLLQGTVDALFAPGQSIDTYDRLRSNGVPVKMVWYCGGHGTCTTGGEDPENVRRIALRWLNRWLRPNPNVHTGPAFEWVSDDGVWRTGPDYPLASDGQLTASGFGHLVVRDQTEQPGGPAFAKPGIEIVNATFPASRFDLDVVGAPTVHLTYRGTATPARTFLYAQIIDGIHNRVVSNQVTPIPVLLDGQGHSTTVPMEVVTAHMTRDSIYRLQITPSSTVFMPQRSTGRIDEMTIEGTLPIVDAQHSGRPGT